MFIHSISQLLKVFLVIKQKGWYDNIFKFEYSPLNRGLLNTVAAKKRKEVKVFVEFREH
jgi:hypothetical protein